MDIGSLFDRPADPALVPPERRILVAALDCIAESGLPGATVRAIAARAGLNPAAVNYYYRSKEKLVEAALRDAWAHLAEDIERIMGDTKDAAEAREAAARFVLEGAFRYPNIIRAIIVEQSPLREEAIAYFKALFARLHPPGGAEREAGLGTLLLLSLTLFVGIAPEAVAALTGMDLRQGSERELLGTLVAPRCFS